MSLSQGLVLKQAQTLALTPQLLQAVKILQLSSHELEEFIAEEAQKNPFITLVKPAPSINYDVFTTIAEPVTLQAHVAQQLLPKLFDKTDKAIGDYLIACLEETGYLTQPLAQMPFAQEDLAAILPLLQSCTPVGVGARDLCECLALQLRAKNRLDPLMQAFLAELPLIAARDFKALQKKLNCSLEDLQEMLRELKALTPKPGLAFERAPLVAPQPDILVTKTREGALNLALNSDNLPKFLVNEAYATTLAALKLREEEKSFIKENLSQGLALKKALAQRCETLLRVSGEILLQQEAFFQGGHLKPMTLLQVGEKLELHESTISRAVAHKTLLCPRGFFELKYFFTTALAGDISAETLKNRIKSLIETEEKVLSDDDLVVVLAAEGYSLARRTVAKYREGLGLASSVMRKRAKSFS